MYYFNLRHNTKQENSSKNTFHYLTRTAHFAQHKEYEKVEFIQSGNMPLWAKNSPGDFWGSADKYEISRGRTATVLTIALPKELSIQHRTELVQTLIHNFTQEYQFPYTAAVHNHESSLTGEDQPHLHLMYSERSLSDGIERPAEQFFKQYRPKNPKTGGAPKITANALGQGKNQIKTFRYITEQLINQALQSYAPVKTIRIKDLEFEVKNQVCCLSNADYNQQYGTQLKDVPQIPRWKLHSPDPIIRLEVEAQKATIADIRAHNLFEIYKTEYENAKQQQEQATLPLSAFEAAKDLQIYQTVNEKQSFYESWVVKLDELSKEVIRRAKLQDYANYDHYLDDLHRKQSVLMELIKFRQTKETLQMGQKILKNDLKLINALIQQYPIKPYYRDQSIHSTQYKIDYVQEQLEILDFIQQNKQKTAIPKPEPTPQKRREDDFEPPSPF